MGLIQSLISKDKYNLKCPYTMPPKGVCIHNTYNDASAANEIAYMKSNSNSTSFHIAIDDVEAIQGLPLNRNGWHAGDGTNGAGNRNYIGVEICYSKSGGTKFINAEKRAAVEVAALLKQFGWTIANVKKHQDFSGKYCPHRTLDKGWQRFLNMIQLELNNLNSQTYANSKKVQNENQKIDIVGTEKLVNSYKESGTFTCKETLIYFRNKVGINSKNSITGNYKKNESVKYDSIVITDKYVYISWISGTRIRRYMPIRDIKNGKYGALWGTIK